jgi:hypothetical protein
VPFILEIAIGALIYMTGVSLLQLSWIQAATAVFIYLNTPMNCFMSATMTARPLGLIFFLFYMYFAGWYIQNGTTLFLGLASLAIALLLVSQRMIAQILFIVTPLVILYLYIVVGTLYWHPIFSIIGGIIMAIIISKGSYLNILSDHLKRISYHAMHGHQSDFKKRLENPLRIIKSNPWTLILFVVPILYSSENLTAEFYMAYAVGIFILAQFWYLGNGANHIYFSSPLVALYLSKYMSLSSIITTCMIGIGLISFFLIIREFKAVRKKKYISKEWMDCFEFIQRGQLKGRIIILPEISCTPIIYFTDLVLVAAGNGSSSMSYNRLFLKRNIMDKKFLKKFIETNSIDYLLIEKAKYPLNDFLNEQGDMVIKCSQLFENRILGLYVCP